MDGEERLPFTVAMLGSRDTVTGYVRIADNAIFIFRPEKKDHILLETDAPDMILPEDFIAFPLPEGANHPANLGRIARAFEDALGADMTAKVGENGRRFWRRA